MDDDCDLVTDENSIAAGITPLGSLDICGTGSVILQADAGEGYTYQWYRNDTSIAGATNLQYTATIVGLYTVHISNLSNCSNTSSAINVIYNCRINENNSGSEQAKVFLYPNPTAGNFVVEISYAISTHDIDAANNLCFIWVTNTFGQNVYSELLPISKNLLKKEIILPDALAAGLYIVHVIVKNEIDTAHSFQWNSKITLQK